MFIHKEAQLLKTFQHLLSNSSLHTCHSLRSSPSQDILLKVLKGHVYKEAWSVCNLPSIELSKYLLNQVLYNKDGIVALNKPFGLSSNKLDVNIYDSIPFLAKHLGHEDLKIVSIPNKYNSGVTILAANSAVENAIDKSMRRARAQAPTNTKSYLAVTAGVPLKEKVIDQFGVTKQRKGEKSHALILRKWSNQARKRREVNTGQISCTKVQDVNVASLVSVGTWLYQHHCVRIFLSDVLLSPVLGDEEFGVRVGTLFNQTVHIKPWLAPKTKRLPNKLLLPLHLSEGEERFIPLHLHLHELHLRDLFGRKLDLIIRAPPSKYFQWTCQQLELSIPDTKPCELVTTDLNCDRSKESHFSS